jgi:hypothetical protein
MVSAQDDWHWSQLQRWVFNVLLISDLYEMPSKLDSPDSELPLEGIRLLGRDPGYGSFWSGLFVNARFVKEVLQTTGGYEQMHKRWFNKLNVVQRHVNQVYTHAGGTHFPPPWRDKATFEDVASFVCTEHTRTHLKWAPRPPPPPPPARW